MSLIRYTPYSAAHMQQQLNQILDQFDTDLFGRSEELGGGMFTPAVDVKEDADAYVVQMEVPGVKQDNLNISLQENVLTIRGHKTQQQERTEGQFRRVERSYGSFARSLSLARHVDGDGVTANLHDGVLEVRLPKLEAAKPRQITVGHTVQSGATPAALHPTGGAGANADAPDTTEVDNSATNAGSTPKATKPAKTHETKS